MAVLYGAGLGWMVFGAPSCSGMDMQANLQESCCCMSHTCLSAQPALLARLELL
jgi:hypothetical protein